MNQSATSAVPARVGIVGGGQLGRMLALAAAPLGIHCTVIDPSPDAGAQIAADHVVAAYDDVEALRQLAASNDVVTFEFENVPALALAAIAADGNIAPPPRALETSQDRLTEKELFASLGIATAPQAAVGSFEELQNAVERLGRPAILKTRRLGYDGKGQAAISEDTDLAAAWSAVGEAPSILEGRVNFKRELSVIAARSSSGELAIYPPTENDHVDGILRTSTIPVTDLSAEQLATARGYAQALLNELRYVGVLALELFDTGDALIANEFAPRVHNSGHWTIDAAPTSQFENHIRAVLGLPLGATEPAQPCVMLNLIGSPPDPASVLAVPGAHLHLYDKVPREGRKVGHITVTAAQGSDLEDSVAQLTELVKAATH